MTTEQTERLLELLDKIETSLSVMADYSEKLALRFEAVTPENSSGTHQVRVVSI